MTNRLLLRNISAHAAVRGQGFRAPGRETGRWGRDSRRGLRSVTVAAAADAADAAAAKVRGTTRWAHALSAVPDPGEVGWGRWHP
jgi:hypothetical protein